MPTNRGFLNSPAVLWHEAGHVIAHQTLHPAQLGVAWVSEGLAERGAELAMRGAVDDPLTQTLCFAKRVQHARMSADADCSVDQLVLEDHSRDSDRGLQSTWYARAWLLVKYLQEEHGDAWEAFLSDLPGIPPESLDESAVFQRLLTRLGMSRGELEDAWVDWISDLEAAPWLPGLGTWWLSEDGIETDASTSSAGLLLSPQIIHAEAFSVSVDARLHYSERGRVEVGFTPAGSIEAGTRWAAAVRQPNLAGAFTYLDRRWTRHRSVTFAPGHLPSDEWITVTVDLSPGLVAIHVGDQEALTTRMDHPLVDHRPLRCGFGALGSRATFRNMVVSVDDPGAGSAPARDRLAP